MPHRARWRQPFIYTTADISTLMEAARNTIASPLRAATYQTLIGLLAASGMFSKNHPLWRKSDLRVCAAQGLME